MTSCGLATARSIGAASPQTISTRPPRWRAGWARGTARFASLPGARLDPGFLPSVCRSIVHDRHNLRVLHSGAKLAGGPAARLAWAGCEPATAKKRFVDLRPGGGKRDELCDGGAAGSVRAERGI